MSRVKTSRQLTQIERLLEHTSSLLEEHIRKGDYVEAENCRINIEQLKREREAARVRDLTRRHEEERHALALQKEAETKELFLNWETRLQLEAGDAETSERELKTRQAMEESHAKQDLQANSPIKVKESPECLNLRRQEAYMVKQKNYAQAHIVQQQIEEMQHAERVKWMANRKSRIETAIKHLRERHENERANLQKNIKATLNESKKLRGKQEETLALKFSNLQRELGMKQEKQKLALKGEFTSKGGEGSPLLTKSRLLKSRE